MKRRTFLASALALTASSALGTIALAQAKQRITWWYEAADPQRQENIRTLLIEPFNAASTQYEVTIDYRGNEIDKQLRVALLSGSGPDIVYTAGPSYVAPMAKAGQLLALDDYAASYRWNERILPVFIDMGRYDGKLYALPKTYETLGLFYNKTLFEKNGWAAPKTIADLEDVAAKALATGIVPFASGNANWRPANEHYVSIVLNAIAGPDNVYKALTGEMPWTAAPFVQAVETLNRWWQAGYFGPNYFSLSDEQAFAQMASGQAAMMPTGTWQFQRIATYFPANNAEAGFVGFPTADGIAGPIYPLGIGSTFSIAAGSQQPDGAAAVIDAVFSPDFYARMNAVWQGEWNTPLRDPPAVPPSEGNTPLYAETMRQLSDAVEVNRYGYTTWTFLPPATDTYLVSGIEEVWLGRSDAATFLAQLDATFQGELAEGKVPTVPAR